MAKPLRLRISVDGSIKLIYDDRLNPLLHKLGIPSITRASHVEPTVDGQWIADLAPVNGPKIGPFKLRSEALDREVEWLSQNVIGYGTH